MFTPDSDFFDSTGDSSYHQDPFAFSPSLAPHRHRKQPGARRGPPMSARQNKKQRKGRNNANNRERTVTTLTEDPNTPYLVPTPSEEPAGGHMAAPFTGAVVNNAKMHNMSIPGQQPYQIPGNFGFGYSGTFAPNLQSNLQQQPQQPFFSPNQAQQASMQSIQPNPPLPPGKNDLEILQNLKKLIIENQHPFFRAIPQPAALASLYKGPLSAQSQSQGRPTEQGITEIRKESADGQAGSGLAPTPTYASGAESTRRQSRMQAKVGRAGPPPTSAGGNQQNDNGGRQGSGNLISSLGLSTHKIGTNNPGPPSADSEPRTSEPPLSGASEDVSDHRGRYDSSGRSHARPDSGSVGGNRPVHSSAYDSSEPTDDPMDGGGAVYSATDTLSRPGSWAPRPPAPSAENGTFEADRNTPQPNVVSNVDTHPPGNVHRDAQTWVYQDRSRRDRPHDQRSVSYRDRRPSAAADRRPQDTGLSQPPARRDDDEMAIPDARRLSDATRPPPAADRPPHVSVAPSNDARPPADFRPTPNPAPTRLEREDVHASRASLGRPLDASNIAAPLPPPSTSPHAPLDDFQGRPSQQEIMFPPNQSRLSSEAPSAQGEHVPPSNSRPQYHDRQKKKFYKNQGGGAGHAGARNNFAGPPRDVPPGFEKPNTQGPPPLSGGAHRSFQQRSPSVDGRNVGKVPPSPTGTRPRDFRGPGPGRDVSRDRGPPGPYRPEYDPDVPPPARYDDGRLYGRDYSPPPPVDRGRTGAYPPPSQSPAGGPPGGRDWGYGAYPPGRRDYPPEEDPYYNKSRGGWDGPPPTTGDRERYDRDYPPQNTGWDARPERDFVSRDGYPPGPPPHDERYAERPRPAGYVAPVNRVRPRSPSPMRRAGPGPVDDPRPPMKRPREEYPPTDYYPPGGRDGVRRPPADYLPPPPRSGSLGPPPGSGTSWAQSSSISSGPPGAGSPPERDYRISRYPPPPASGGYDRPRSPGPPVRGGYNNRGGGAGGYGREGSRGGYGMPPPRP